MSTTTVRRIAVVGAECVGKTTLCQQLAEALPGLWLPEYLREFCERAGRTPRPDEQPGILQRQVELETEWERRAALGGLGWLFCDSAPIVTALYSRMLFSDDALTAQALSHHRRYAATLLLDPDLPWAADGILRDGPSVRSRYHGLLLETLDAAAVGYTRVSGEGLERLRRALGACRPD